MAAGTKDDPWALKTPPGTSEYTMDRDDKADPALIVCQVGSTEAHVSGAGDRGPLGLAAQAGRLGVARFGRREQGPSSGDGRGVRAFAREPSGRLVREA